MAMTINFSTTSPLSGEKAREYLQQFAQTYQQSKDNAGEISTVNADIKNLSRFINDSMKNTGLDEKLTLKVWLREDGKVGAFCRQAAGSTKVKLPTRESPPLHKMREADITLEVQGEKAGVSIRPQAAGTIQDLVAKTLLAHFITATIDPLDSAVALMAQLEIREEQNPGIAGIMQASAKILSG
jgi:hypothetical protein